MCRGALHAPASRTCEAQLMPSDQRLITKRQNYILMNNKFTLSDFNYELPKELIAQRPADPRDSSRLLCLNRCNGTVSECVFRDIIELLDPDDLLVVNDSKVIPARLLGTKEDTGANVEVLLLRELGDGCWECLVKPGRRLKPGARAVFGNGELRGVVERETEGGNRVVKFEYVGDNFFAVLDKVGNMPLPHYISEPLKNTGEYQTVYAEIEGSAAAPTAGFHFTAELLEGIKQKGVGVEKVTLHVGLGTFRPVKEKDITKHLMHSEFYSIPEQTARAIEATKQKGGRVIAVGTTTCRTLEAAAKEQGSLTACSGSTDIFIYPGYSFKVIDALITNFHLPESTLIMLVSAFAGYQNTMDAYKFAVDNEYRFFSFGDAMFIY